MQESRSIVDSSALVQNRNSRAGVWLVGRMAPYIVQDPHLMPGTGDGKRGWGESVKTRSLRIRITTVTFSYLAVLFILPFRKRFLF